MSKDKKKPDTRPAAGAETSAEEAADLDAVMRKYDRESATRMWEGTPQLLHAIEHAACRAHRHVVVRFAAGFRHG